MDFSKHTDKFAIFVNAIPLGQVTNYWIERTEVKETEDVPCPYTIKIRRRIATNPNREMIDFYDYSKFNITFVRAGVKITFAYCTVSAILEEIGEDRLIYETLTFSSPVRAITDENNPEDPFN